MLRWAHETSTACSPQDTSVAMPLQNCQQSPRSLPPEEQEHSDRRFSTLLHSRLRGHVESATRPLLCARSGCLETEPAECWSCLNGEAAVVLLAGEALNDRARCPTHR